MNARVDIALVSKRPSMRISRQGAISVIRYMSGRQFIGPVYMTETADWIEFHGVAGDFAHAIFHDGEATRPAPAFMEVGLRFGTARQALGYGEDDEVYWFLEFRGALFDDVVDDFVERLHSILYCHPLMWTRPHTELRSREGAPAPHKPGKRERGEGRAGVLVEDL